MAFTCFTRCTRVSGPRRAAPYGYEWLRKEWLREEEEKNKKKKKKAGCRPPTHTHTHQSQSKPSNLPGYPIVRDYQYYHENIAMILAVNTMQAHLRRATEIAQAILLRTGWKHHGQNTMQRYTNKRYGNKEFTLQRAFECENDRLKSASPKPNGRQTGDYEND